MFSEGKQSVELNNPLPKPETLTRNPNGCPCAHLIKRNPKIVRLDGRGM